MSEFDRPASSSGIRWEEHLGRLLLIEPHSVETEVRTVHGERDAVRADVTVLDGPDAPIQHTDVLIFPSVLISQTRSRVGRRVLGRLSQGVAKPGQKPPWTLVEFEEQDAVLATSYLASRNRRTFTRPAPAAVQDEPPF